MSARKKETLSRAFRLADPEHAATAKEPSHARDV